MAGKIEYLPNAFWEDGCDDRSQMKCIRVTHLDNGKRQKDVLLLNKGELEYKTVLGLLGVETIDNETNDRRKRKKTEGESKRVLHEQKRKQQQLENLFNLKIQAFEIPEIKESENRAMRSRMRKAQSEIELNALTALCLGKEMGMFDGTD